MKSRRHPDVYLIMSVSTLLFTGVILLELTQAPEWMIYAAFGLSVLNALYGLWNVWHTSKIRKPYITIESREFQNNETSHAVNFIIHAGEWSGNVNALQFRVGDRILLHGEYRVLPEFETTKFEKSQDKEYQLRFVANPNDSFLIIARYDGRKTKYSNILKLRINQISLKREKQV
jgi:hypothetical protein